MISTGAVGHILNQRPCVRKPEDVNLSISLSSFRNCQSPTTCRNFERWRSLVNTDLFYVWCPGPAAVELETQQQIDHLCERNSDPFHRSCLNGQCLDWSIASGHVLLVTRCNLTCNRIAMDGRMQQERRIMCHHRESSYCNHSCDATITTHTIVDTWSTWYLLVTPTIKVSRQDNKFEVAA